MKAIILAAGYATRLFPLTKDFPKALLTVGGMPLMDHIVAQLDKIPEIDRIHVVTNARFYKHFSDWAEKKQDARICIHDDGTSSDEDKRGAIGDIQFVIEETGLDDDCLIVAGDNLLMIDYKEFYDFYLAHGRNTLLMAKKLDDLATLRRFAVAELDEEHRVVSLVEKPAQPASDNGVFALYLYPAKDMRRIREYLKEGNSPDAPGHYPVWLVKQQPVYAFVTEQACYDIGTHESLREVRDLYGE